MAAGDVNIFNQAIQLLPDALLKSYEKAGDAAKFLITDRIQETGAAADGQQFQTKKPYSEKYLAYKTGEGPNPFSTSPAKLPSNRYRGFVDFTLTGFMWNNIGQVMAEVNEKHALVTIGAKSPETQQKLDNIANLWGDPLDVSTAEQEQLAQTLDDELQFHLDIIFK